MKQSYSVKTPKQIRFGDPDYWVDFKGKKLKSLVVARKITQGLKTVVSIEQESFDGFPCVLVKICCALEQDTSVYMNGRMYEGDKLVEKAIGVDSARYLLSVDVTSTEIHTLGDGCWGSEVEFRRSHEGKSVLMGVLINITLPDEWSFDKAKSLVECLFTDVKVMKGVN